MNGEKVDRRPKTELDTQGALERIGDRELYREIAHYFAGHLDESVGNLRRALYAGDESDLTLAVRLAHSLKGNCATVGAELSRAECYALETLCRSGNLLEARAQFVRLLPLLEALKPHLLAI